MLASAKKKYVKGVYDFQVEVDAMRKIGHSPEEMVRYASNRRNDIKKPIEDAYSKAKK